jgi:sulfatase maturation enzyme AslB (radical SAM superfamily)
VVRYSGRTNGTGLDEQALTFFVGQGFEVQISFDGVRESQDLRSPGSFDQLDDLLDQLKDSHPTYFRHRLRIATIVTPQSLSYLPRSVAYFLEKGVRTVILAPDFTVTDGWHLSDIDRLDRAFARIFELSGRHYDETGGIPIRMFRSPPRRPPAQPHGRSLCGIMRGETPAVDTDGEVYGCGAVVSSYQELSSDSVITSLQKVRLGHIEDPQLAVRLIDYRRLTKPVGLFDDKQNNWSSYGRCGNCKYLYSCAICPVSIGYVSDNENMNRVSDFLCAFNLVSLKYRERFCAQINRARVQSS